MVMKRWLLVIELLLTITLPGFSQSYDSLWKQVDAMLAKDLPASVVTQCATIYAKAEKEGNIAQMMRAFCYSMAGREMISPDSLQVDVTKLKVWAESEKNPCHRAVLYSILAQKDHEHREEYLCRSLQDVDALRKYDATNLTPMVKPGDDSRRYFGNSLLDVLARRALDLLPTYGKSAIVNDVFHALLHAYADNREASLLIRLQRLNNYRADSDGDTDEQLIREYGDLELCCEAYIRLAVKVAGRSKAQRMELVEEGLRKYPHYKRINALKIVKNELEMPHVDIAISCMCPNTETMIEVKHCNSKGFSLLVYKLRLQTWEIDGVRVNEKNVKQYGELYTTEHFNLPPTPDYERTTTLLPFTTPRAGVYFVMVKPDEKEGVAVGKSMAVSRMALLSREIGNKQMECVVLDALSGHPLENVNVGVFLQDNNNKSGREIQRGVSDARGCVVFHEIDERATIRAEKDGDVSLPLSYYNYYARDWRKEESDNAKKQHCWIFTDRAVYRPGQIVQFAGCAFNQQGDEIHVKQQSDVIVKLLDTSNAAIDSLTLKVDTMGSFSGLFRLPDEVKPGKFAIEALEDRARIRVEEYKRPTFEIVFDKVNDAYRWGDSVNVAGTVRTLAGAPLQLARVKYVQNMTTWVGWMQQRKGIEGVIQTDDEGRFCVPLVLRDEEIDDMDTYAVCELLVDVTSLSGESHQAKQMLHVGKNSLRIQLEVPDCKVWRKERMPQICMKVTNLDDNPIATMVDYQIAAWQDNMEWEKVLVLQKGQCESNQPFVPAVIANLPSGEYVMKAVVRDNRDQEVSQEVRFLLFSEMDKTISAAGDLWTYSELDSVSGKVVWWCGTKHDDAYVMTDIYDQRVRMERKTVVLKDGECAKYGYDVSLAKGDGVEVKVMMMKAGKVFDQQLEFAKLKPKKQLTMKWCSFRNKLQPGENEIWSLQVLNADGSPAQAQLVATLYDASLDLLNPLHWTYSHVFQRFIPRAFVSLGYRSNLSIDAIFKLPNLSLPSFQYSKLDVPTNDMFMRSEFVSNSMREIVTVGYGRVVQEKMVVNPQVASIAPDESREIMELEPQSLRNDFSETAFFSSQLMTNAKGEVSLSFTLPESLTRWHFLAFAHDKKMNTGLLADEVVAQKKLMLQSQLPRFVRVGDEVEWQALVSNVSVEAKHGMVQMEILNAKDSSIVACEHASFDLEAGKSVAMKFRSTISDGCDELVVRMQADGGDCKDGEQHIVPVLSNKVMVADTRSFTMRGKGTFNYTFDNLFNNHSRTATEKKLTVNFVDNALWFVWQALPALQLPVVENVVTLAAHYYANKMERLMGHRVGSIDEVLGKLKALQQGDGGWSWCRGMQSSRVLTTQVVVMLARLRNRGVDVSDMESQQKGAMEFLRKRVQQEYDEVKALKGKRVYSEEVLKYIYAKVLFGLALDDGDKHCINQVKKNPRMFTIYGKAAASYLLDAADEKQTAKEFLNSIMEYTVATDDMGRYFDTPKAPYCWCSYRIPTQSMVIEALHGFSPNTETEAEMKQWLLKQKQVQQWENVVATVDAVYALSNEGVCNMDSLEVKQEIYEEDVDTLCHFSHCKTTDGIGWGSVCASYAEDLGKVMPEQNGLGICRRLLLNGKPVEGSLHVGDRVTVCLDVTADRDMDFVEITDERAACMEPAEAFSRYEWQNNIGCYRQVTDHATCFSIDKMRKGKYTIKHDVYVTAAGIYAAGIATVRSAYASEFAGRTRKMEIRVK